MGIVTEVAGPADWVADVGKALAKTVTPGGIVLQTFLKLVKNLDFNKLADLKPLLMGILTVPGLRRLVDGDGASFKKEPELK